MEIETTFSQPSVKSESLFTIETDFPGLQMKKDEARAEEAKTVPSTEPDQPFTTSAPAAEYGITPRAEVKVDPYNILTGTDKALINVHNTITKHAANVMEEAGRIPNFLTDLGSWLKDDPTFNQAYKQRMEDDLKSGELAPRGTAKYSAHLSDDDLKALLGKEHGRNPKDIDQWLVDEYRAGLELEGWSKGREPISDAVRTWFKNNAQSFRDKILANPNSVYADDITDAIAGATSSAPGIIEFMLGGIPAFTRSAVEAQEAGYTKGAQAIHGVKGWAEFMTLKKIFGSLHPLAAKYGTIGQVEQALGGGTTMAMHGTVRPDIDDYLDKTLLGNLPGYNINDIDAYNEHLKIREDQQEKRWKNFVTQLIPGIALSYQPKPPAGYKYVPKKQQLFDKQKVERGEYFREGSLEKQMLRFVFGGEAKVPAVNKYFDLQSKAYIDLNAIEQGLMFDSNSNPVVVGTMLSERISKSPVKLGERGTADFISDIAGFMREWNVLPRHTARAILYDKEKQGIIMHLPSIPSPIGRGIHDNEASEYAGKKMLVSVATSPNKGHVPWSAPIEVDYIAKHDGKHIFVYKGDRYVLEDRHFRLAAVIGEGKREYSYPTEGEFTQQDLTDNPNTIFITNSKDLTGNNKRVIPDDVHGVENILAEVRSSIRDFNKEPAFITTLPAKVTYQMLSGERKGFVGTKMPGEIGQKIRLFVKRGEEQVPGARYNYLIDQPEVEGGKRKVKDFIVIDNIKIDSKNISEVSKILQIPPSTIDQYYKGQWVSVVKPFEKYTDVKVSLDSFRSRPDYDYLYNKFNDIVQYSDSNLPNPIDIKVIHDVQHGKEHNIQELIGRTPSGKAIYLTTDGRWYTEDGYELVSSPAGRIKPLQSQGVRKTSRKGFEYQTSGYDPLYSNQTFPITKVKGVQADIFDDPAKPRVSVLNMLLEGKRTGHIIGANEAHSIDVGDVIPIEYAKYHPTKKDANDNSVVTETAILYVRVTGKEKVFRSDLGKYNVKAKAQPEGIRKFLNDLSDIEGLDPDYLNWYYNQKNRFEKVWYRGEGYILQYELMHVNRDFPFTISNGEWHVADFPSDVTAKGFLSTYLKAKGKAEVDITDPKAIQELTYEKESEYNRARTTWVNEYDKEQARLAGKAAVWSKKLSDKCYDLYTDIDGVIPEILITKEGVDKIKEHITSIMESKEPSDAFKELLEEGTSHGYSVNDVINMAVADITTKVNQPHNLTLMQYVKGQPEVSAEFYSEIVQDKWETPFETQKGWGHKPGETREASSGFSRERVSKVAPGTEIQHEIVPPSTESEAKVMSRVMRRLTIVDVPTEHGYFETVLGGERFAQLRAEHMKIKDRAYANGDINPLSDMAKIDYLTYPEIYWKYGKPYRDYLSSLTIGEEPKYKSMPEAYTKELGQQPIDRVMAESERAALKYEEMIGKGEEQKYEKDLEDTKQARDLDSLKETLEDAHGRMADGFLDFTGLLNYFKSKVNKRTAETMYATNHNIFELLKKYYTGSIKPEDKIKALEMYDYCKAVTANIVEIADRTHMSPEKVATQIFLKYFDLPQSESLARIYTETEYKNYLLKTQLDDVLLAGANVILTTKRIPEKGEWWKETKEDSALSKDRIEGWVTDAAKKIYNSLSYYRKVPDYARYEIRQTQVDVDQINKFSNNIITLTDKLSHAEERLGLDYIQFGAEMSRLPKRRGGEDPAEFQRLNQLIKDNDNAINALSKPNKKMLKAWIKTMQSMIQKTQSYLVDVGDLKDISGKNRVFSYYAPLKVFPYEFESVRRYITMPRRIKNPVQTYTYSTKGLKQGQDYLPLTTYDLVEHLANVRYDIVMKELVKKVTTAYDINDYVGETFKRNEYKVEKEYIKNALGQVESTVETMREWGRPGPELYKGSEIISRIKDGEGGDSSKINPDKYYKVWSPDWQSEVRDYDPLLMEQTGDIPQVLGYKKTFLLERNLADAMDSLNPTPNKAWQSINLVNGWWKRQLIYSIYPKFLTGNHLGDYQMFAWMHPEAKQALSFSGSAKKALFYELMQNHPNGKAMYEKKFGKMDLTDFEKNALELARNTGVLEAGLMNDIFTTMSSNKFTKVFNVLGELAQGREAWLRLTNTMYMLNEYEAGRGLDLVKKFSWLPNLSEAQDLDGQWNQIKLISQIGKTFSIDYMRKSPGYSRYISGFAAPFAKFNVDGSVLANRYLIKGYQGKTPGQKMSHAMKSLGGLFVLPIVAEVGNIIVESMMDDEYVEERRKVEASLHPGVRQRTHFIMGKKDDGSWMMWVVPNPMDMLFGTKIASQMVGLANKLRTGEVGVKQGLKDFFKDYGLSEAKWAAYVASGPFLRFGIGMFTHKDPYDGTPIARTADWSQLGSSEMAWVVGSYFTKCTIPWMASYTVNIQNKNQTISGGVLDFVKDFADIAEWIGVRWRPGRTTVPPEKGYTETPSGGIMYTQRKEMDLIEEAEGDLKNVRNDMLKDWVRSGLDPKEFIQSEEFEAYTDKYIRTFTKYTKDRDRAEEYFERNAGSIIKSFMKRTEDADWMVKSLESKIKTAPSEEREELINQLSIWKYRRGEESKKRKTKLARELDKDIIQGLVGGD